MFASGNTGKPLSNMAMAMLLSDGTRQSDGARVSFNIPHWSAEATNYPREIAEKALAHAVGDETERSYQRGDLLEKRQLMGEWANFCARATDNGGGADPGVNVAATAPNEPKP